MTTATRAALALATAARVPVLLWGGPGIGKTSAIREMAEASNLACEVVIASIREPSDFAGLPVVASDGEQVSFAPPRWAERLASAERAILFLDEISTAPPSVQAALLRVVLERTVGDLHLGEGVTILAAANPPDQAADGWDLSPPLANRFCHLDWTLTPTEWADGLLGGFDTHSVPLLDEQALQEAVAPIRATIGAFATSHPAAFHALPQDESAAGRAWPSPRTWDMAARLLAAAEATNATNEVAALLAAGAVGPGAATEYLAWRQELELPDPETVLGDPSSFRLPDRGDRAYAALANITAAVMRNNTPDRWEAAWLAIAAATKDGHADIAIAAIRALIGHRPDGAAPPRGVLSAMAPVLREAGLFDRLQA